MSNVKNIFSESVIYSSTDLYSSAVSYLLIPVFTFFLSVHQYGQLALYQSAMTVLFTLIMWGTGSSLGSFYHFKEYRDRYTQVKSVTVRSLLGFNLLFLTVSYIVLSSSLELNLTLLVLVFLAAYFSVIRTAHTVYFIHSRQPWRRHPQADRSGQDG